MNDRDVKVAIVFPVHNRRELTLQCLASLSEINKTGLDVKIYVVDDGSTDGTSEAIAAKFPEVNIIKGDGDLWFTEGTNVGVRAALEHDPDHVVMMNDDQVFDREFLVSLVNTAQRFPRSVVGSLLLLWDRRDTVFQVAPMWNVWWGCWRHWYKQSIETVPDRPWEVDLIVGNCALVPREAIEECGLMRSDRYPNFGDAEYTPRLKRNGWRLLIDPGSKVYCQPNTVPAKVMKMDFRQKLNALFLDLRHIQNLRRRFYCYWDSAPSKLQAVAGYLIFFVRVAIGRNYEGNWALEQAERPLKELFADRIAAE